MKCHDNLAASTFEDSFYFIPVSSLSNERIFSGSHSIIFLFLWEGGVRKCTMMGLFQNYLDLLAILTPHADANN